MPGGCYLCNCWGHDDTVCKSVDKAAWAISMEQRCVRAHAMNSQIVDNGNLPYRGASRRMPGRQQGRYPLGKGRVKGGTMVLWTPEQLVTRLKNQEIANAKFDAALKSISDKYPNIVPYDP